MKALYNYLCEVFFRYEVRRMRWTNLATPGKELPSAGINCCKICNSSTSARPCK